MKAREFDPLHLDVEVFAKDGGHLEGAWPLRALTRLVETAPAEASPAERDGVAWQARGELRPQRGGAGQIWLHLAANAEVAQQCQRCLMPVTAVLAVERSFQFVAGEDAAAELDADSEEDVLALTRSLDLRGLVEDELLLELPLVPRHDVCPQPLPIPADDLPEGEPAPNPFAALAVLKKGAPGAGN